MILRRRPQNSTLTAQVEYLRRKRKTGRLTFTYPEGYGDFYFKAGELIDAKVEQLSGPAAVFLTLTLSNITFNFDPTIQTTQRTIYDSWEALVSDAQRQLNEGQLPSELFIQDDEFETAWSRLVETPLSSVRRAAVYRASLGKWNTFLDAAASLAQRFNASVGWGVALASTIVALTVLMAVSIVALNQGFEQQQPQGSVQSAPQAAPAAQNVLAPNPQSGAPALPDQDQAKSPAAASRSSNDNNLYTDQPAKTESTILSKTAEPAPQTGVAQATQDQNAASEPAAVVPPADNPVPDQPAPSSEIDESKNREPEDDDRANDEPEDDDRTNDEPENNREARPPEDK